MNEQLSIFDVVTEKSREPIDDWWQYSADNEVIYHAYKYCDENIFGEKVYHVESGERLTKGREKYEFCRKNTVLNWIDAENEKRCDIPLDYMTLRDLAVRGRDIRRYIAERGVSPTSFANRTTDYIVSLIYGQAKDDAISDEVETRCNSHYEHIRECYDKGNLTEDWLRKYYGIGGEGGPDSARLNYNAKGIEFSWSGAEEGGIYPFNVGYGEMCRRFQQYLDMEKEI